MFALVDVNNFYASCEQVFRPDLRFSPVVVVSNNDGCIISRTQEAKLLGIKMGEPYFSLRQRLQQQGVHVFSSNYALYGDMSARVMGLLEEIAPALEIYSIDEAFLHIPGMDHCIPLETFGRQVQTTIKNCTGLPVGVGIAPTKTLAKLANYAAKRWPQTGGVVDLSSPIRQRKLLAATPVEEVWGIGRRISKKLNMMGIESALHLSERPPWFMRKHFNVMIERTVRELRGEPCLALEEYSPDRQQIIYSRSFGQRIIEYSDMRQAVCAYAEQAASRLRGAHQYCRRISVFIRTSPRERCDGNYSNQATSVLMTPSQDARDIIFMATRALRAIWRDGFRYMKAGVMLSDLFSQGVAQPDLFDSRPPKANSAALMSVMDRINRGGQGHIWFAGQGIQQPWAMKREMLSPAYTTCYADIPVAT